MERGGTVAVVAVDIVLVAVRAVALMALAAMAEDIAGVPRTPLLAKHLTRDDMTKTWNLIKGDKNRVWDEDWRYSRSRSRHNGRVIGPFIYSIPSIVPPFREKPRGLAQ